MRKSVRKLALVVTGASLFAVGLIVAACGTDNGTVATPTPPTAESGTGKETSTGRDGSVDNDGGVDAAVEADCTKAPKLRTTTAGFFCAFYRSDGGADGGGSTSNCANDEICCNPSGKSGADFFPSFCASASPKAGDDSCNAQAATEGSSYDGGGSAWECADKNSCGGSGVCCMIQDPKRLPDTLNIGNFPKNDTDVPPACNAKRAYNAGGTRCRSACNAGEIKMCSLSDDNCGGGSVCTPVQGFFRDLGYCFP